MQLMQGYVVLDQTTDFELQICNDEGQLCNKLMARLFTSLGRHSEFQHRKLVGEFLLLANHSKVERVLPATSVGFRTEYIQGCRLLGGLKLAFSKDL
jgi:hypothetical protein